MIDFICTDQWDKDIGKHFQRLTSEWQYSPEDFYNFPEGWEAGKNEKIFEEVGVLRRILMSRYIAYRIFLVANVDLGKDDNLAKVKFEHRYDRNTDQYKVKLEVGDKELSWE